MKPFSLLCGSVCLTVCLVCFFFLERAYAGDVRRPVAAGAFYPSDPSELKQLIEDLTARARKTRVQLPRNKSLKALILPHAGYVYSGWTAAHAALVLKSGQFSKVILLAPDHFIGFKNGAVSDVKAYQTPLGMIKLHTDAADLRKNSDLFRPVPASDRTEHSVEVILPFLQSYLNDFELVPIVVGPTDINRFAAVIDSITDAGTLVVASSDLSHFLSYSEATARDRKTIERIINGKSAELLQSDNVACGVIPIAILLDLARRRHWQAVLLHYSNSGDTAGDRSRVVGYAAVAFYGDQFMETRGDSKQHLSEDQGQVLVKLARRTITEKLGKNVPVSESEAVDSALSAECYQFHCGTFVTLKINGQLRGCIGNLTAKEPVIEGVRQNAVNAAYHDPRFSPLAAKELDRLDIEVSILSEPRPLEYSDGQDLIHKLRVNVDGVIIRKGYAGATFLPQVWEQLPKPEDFLSHLCLKAGLPSNTWRNTKLEVLTYQVQYFEENK
jgi:AmmeMemoRadiSam system protein B/AmmeMemoRadiSam system protein A